MAALAQQLVVSTHLRDGAVFYDENAVGAANSRETMGDDEARAPVEQFFHAPWISASVGVSTELVASSMMKMSGSARTARQADQLFLADGEQAAAFAHLFVVTVFQVANELVGADSLGRSLYLFVGGVEPA